MNRTLQITRHSGSDLESLCGSMLQLGSIKTVPGVHLHSHISRPAIARYNVYPTATRSSGNTS